MDLLFFTLFSIIFMIFYKILNIFLFFVDNKLKKVASMKRNTLSLDEIKNEIEKLKGKDVEMLVNQGRKKFVNFSATVEEIHRSVFVVRLKMPQTVDVKSYSYIDVLTGSVELKFN